MAINKLPPQAFTKDDVTKAYLWIQGQPEYVRNMATSKETLVALYLQAKRSGNASLENLAPVSSQDFKSQLQTLAGELEQFEGPKTNDYFAATKVAPAPVTTPKNPAQNFVEKTTTTSLQVEERISSSSLAVDEKSQEIINTVKAHLNMQSDEDVIRMLLILGYEKIQTIFPGRQ